MSVTIRAPEGFPLKDFETSYILGFKFLQEMVCSPDGAKRNPGIQRQRLGCTPDFASLHPGYERRDR
jgi:hypothetical protein